VIPDQNNFFYSLRRLTLQDFRHFPAQPFEISMTDAFERREKGGAASMEGMT